MRRERRACYATLGRWLERSRRERGRDTVKNKFAPLLSLFGSAYGPNKTPNLIFGGLSTHVRSLLFRTWTSHGAYTTVRIFTKFGERRGGHRPRVVEGSLTRWSVRWQIAKPPKRRWVHKATFNITGSRHGPIQPLADRDISTLPHTWRGLQTGAEPGHGADLFFFFFFCTR